MTPDQLPDCWRAALAAEFQQSYFLQLREFVAGERQHHAVFPPADDVFRAFQLTPLRAVRVVILGQDPYHNENQAHGLSFSVQPGCRIPPSLRNIYRELHDDLGIVPAEHGCLESWAREGVLLLNTVLTVRAHEANSHRRRGWETFTDRVIEILNEQPSVVFVLWGRPAQSKESLIAERHMILKSVHPSPLSARNGFFGSRPFSKANTFLVERDMAVVNWQLPACE